MQDAALARRYEDLGVHRLVALAMARSGDEIVERVERTAAEVEHQE